MLESAKKDAKLKIVDFGASSKFEPNKKLNEKVVTSYYIAPEVL